MYCKKRIHQIVGVSFISLLCVALVAAEKPVTQVALQTELATFKFEGEPIHPACLLLLSTDLADSLPVCAAVDLQGCQQSNRFAIRVTTDESGWYRIADKELTGQGYFRYRYLGHAKDDIHVVETEINDGGSGVFRGGKKRGGEEKGGEEKGTFIIVDE
jgi:hypothetical protein